MSAQLFDLNTQLNQGGEIKALRSLMQTFSAKIVQFSKAAPPPGINAANGWFRNSMVSDPDLQSMTSGHGQFVTPDGAKLYAVFTDFGRGLRAGFAPENHPASVWTDGHLFVQALQQFGGELSAVIGDIVNLCSDDQNKKDKAKADLAKDLNALIGSVKGSKVLYSGAHANGWISGNIKGVGAQIGLRLDALIPQLHGAEAKELATIFRAECSRINRITLHNYHPWLDAQWQVEFQAVIETAAAAFGLAPKHLRDGEKRDEAELETA
jgi:hypothetical protein